MLDARKFKFGESFDVKQAIQSSKVKPDETIKNSEALMSFIESQKTVVICTRGNISAVIGKAKSRKTFFFTMLAASLIRGNLYDKFISPKAKKLKIAYFDTEQGRGRAQKVIKRIVEMSGNYQQIDMLSLRPYSTSERVEIIDEYFRTEKPDFAFLDGVRDLIINFNDLTQSTELMTSLLRWSEAHDCHIMCILHMNKGDGNARGHLGSELICKAESVLSIRMEEGSDFSSVESEYMRDGNFEPFQFTVIDNIPILCGCEKELKDIGYKASINTNERIEPNKDFDNENKLPF